MSQMNNSAIALVPLERVDNSIFPRLGHVLWSWPLCAGCGFGQQCSDATCAARVKRLRRFFQFYTAVVEAYVNESSETSRVLKTHEDLYNAVLALKGDPEMTRIALSNTVSQGKASSPSDIEAATTLAVKVLLMVDCSALHQSSNRLKKGISKVHWKDDVPFNQYLRDLFPVQTNPIFSSAGSDLSPVKSELRATKLKKHLHITLQATHDVRNHLRFDRKNNVLEVFHYTAFLKEQLKLTKGKEDPSDPMTSIKV
ncbi:uncharacterized protein NFIA_004580 [Aspergillus fischeri NRRL 181]|uniref:Uncharacterized protein n=1 Tax=Neosartorya fischeri (strain ATCC 1020 / DSM 3700 / CBS 544.65 / FGSC A1164 / JCM 1740 / NRRL 181 / WB 181) TaxID=331117 RepID=A1DK61_NEOFI|nr:conserved hypothetical protein [Aspergillus fischeri NRRL 181]EAW17100.1 conserved hypothetical protein [Aspergillus fischeri NRRL 181]